MELSHDFVVPAPIAQTWAVFMDLDSVGSCFPGATVESVTADGFAGAVKVKLGLIALVYTGSGHFIERDDVAHRAVIEAKGKDKRGNGTAGATVTIQLAPAQGGAATRVDVATELAITGKPAQFGRGVMQDVSDKLLQQFVRCIEGRFAAPEPGAPAAEPPIEDAAAQPAAAQPAAAQPAAAQPAAAQPAPVAGAHATATDTGAGSDSIDLGATVLPVLLRSYAPHLAAGLIGLVLGWVIGRRSAG